MILGQSLPHELLRIQAAIVNHREGVKRPRFEAQRVGQEEAPATAAVEEIGRAMRIYPLVN